MALEITIAINGNPVAKADAGNLSPGSQSICDYLVRIESCASPIVGEPALREQFWIDRHDNRQSVWALVASIAVEAALREGSALDGVDLKSQIIRAEERSR